MLRTHPARTEPDRPSTARRGLKDFTRFQYETEDTALWFVLNELKMYIACDRVEDTRWCGKWERSFKGIAGRR